MFILHKKAYKMTQKDEEVLFYLPEKILFTEYLPIEFSISRSQKTSNKAFNF